MEKFDFSSVRNLKETVPKFLQASRHLAKSSVVVFNSPPIGPLLFFVFLSKILGKKMVFIFQGGIFVEPRGLLNRINQIILLWELRSKTVEYVITPSRWSFGFIQKHKIRSKVVRIPIGVDFQEIDPYPAARLATKNNLLFVGRLAKIKGIHTLLDALSLLNDEKLGCNLYIAGPKGNLSQNEMKRILEAPNVDFLGKVSHERKISLMKGVDIIVLPSHWGENSPLVVLEGMACAKPVIATSVGGIPQIIDKPGFNGILVPTSDPMILAKAIKDILTNQNKRAELSENAYRTVKNRYDWKTVSPKYLKFLTTIINQ